MKNKDFLIEQRKILFSYMIATTLGVVSLTGCSGDIIEYQEQEFGVLLLNKEVDYNYFGSIKLIRIGNEKTNVDEYYLVTYLEDKYYSEYIDIETREVVYRDNDDSFKDIWFDIVVDDMKDYLLKYDMIKDKYNVDDIEVLKERLLSDTDIIEVKNNKSKVLKR